jgi:hypothetical protein
MTDIPQFDADFARSLAAAGDTVSIPSGLVDRLARGVLAPRPPVGRRPPESPRSHWALPLLAAAATLVAVVTTVAVSARLTGHPEQARPGISAVVPWDPAGTRVSSSTSTTSTYALFAQNVPAPIGTRACVAADLALVSSKSEVRSQGDSDDETISYLLRSRSTCSVNSRGLSGALADAQGHLIARPTGRDFLTGPATGLVRPGELISASTWWYRGPGAARPTRFLLFPTNSPAGLVRSALSITIFGNLRPDDCCESSLLKVQSLGVSVFAEGSLGSLTITIHSPLTVARNTNVHFTAELSNPFDKSVSLDPCPGFVASIHTVLFYTGHFYLRSMTGRLNCAQAPAVIGAHSSVTFAFVLNSGQLPLDAHPKISLSLMDPGQPVTSAGGGPIMNVVP